MFHILNRPVDCSGADFTSELTIEDIDFRKKFFYLFARKGGETPDATDLVEVDERLNRLALAEVVLEGDGVSVRRRDQVVAVEPVVEKLAGGVGSARVLGLTPLSDRA